jgi:superfamily II DNA or RNA helicase
MVDECHHATASTYRTVMGHYGALPDLAGPAVAAGFTATMTRSDRSNLGSVWTDIPFSITMSDLVRRGFLVPPITYHCRIADLDLTKIRKSAGDYVRSELGRAVQESIAPGAVVRAYERHAKGRVALLFTPTVALAEHMAKVFADAGYRTDTVDGKTPERKRESIVSRCRAGRIDILTNCGVFTEGTDLPNVGCIIMMRPTKSTGLFIQMAGRGARLDPNDPTKENYILIDVCGVTQEHTLSGSIDLFGEEVKLKKKEDDEEEFIEEVGDEKEEELEIGQADGPIESILVDIMSPKRPSWRQTPGGAWFLQRKNRRLIAIVPSPEPGKMDVVEMGPSVGDSRMLESGVTSLADCMRIGEIQLTGHEKGMVAQGAKWRSRKASYQLIRTARTFGHTVGYDDIVTAGELEEFISIKQAERRIDPCVMKRMQAVKRYCG